MDKLTAYTEALTKVATAYDGSRGGRISETDMREIAKDVLQLYGDSPFITLESNRKHGDKESN